MKLSHPTQLAVQIFYLLLVYGKTASQEIHVRQNDTELIVLMWSVSLVCPINVRTLLKLRLLRRQLVASVWEAKDVCCTSYLQPLEHLRNAASKNMTCSHWLKKKVFQGSAGSLFVLLLSLLRKSRISILFSFFSSAVTIKRGCSALIQTQLGDEFVQKQTDWFTSSHVKLFAGRLPRGKRSADIHLYIWSLLQFNCICRATNTQRRYRLYNLSIVWHHACTCTINYRDMESCWKLCGLSLKSIINIFFLGCVMILNHLLYPDYDRITSSTAKPHMKNKQIRKVLDTHLQ